MKQAKFKTCETCPNCGATLEILEPCPCGGVKQEEELCLEIQETVWFMTKNVTNAEGLLL